MNKQFLIASAAAITSLTAASAATAAEVSANVAYTTDYRFRGISQTDKDFALQGGFDYAHDSGFYIGTWASNVDDFSPSPVTGDNGAQLEMDFYAGYAADITDSLSFDIGALYYYYPGASTAGDQFDIDYVEYIPAVTYATDDFSSSFSVAWSDDFFGETGDGFYYAGDFEFPLEEWLTLGVHAGYQTIENNERWGTPDYTDWSVTLGTSLVGLDFAVSYVDTDLSESECFGGGDICGATAVGTISKSF